MCFFLFLEALVQSAEKDMRVFTGTFQRKGETHSTFLWETADESLSVTVDWEQEGKYTKNFVFYIKIYG